MAKYFQHYCQQSIEKLFKAIGFYRKAEQLDPNVFSYLREVKIETTLAKPTLGGEFKEAQPEKQQTDISGNDFNLKLVK